MSEGEFISLGDIAAVGRRYAFSILALFALGVGGAAVVVATTDRIYTATTQVLIEPKLPETLMQNASSVNTSLDTAQVESHMTVLRSEKIAQMVIYDLGLMENEEFFRPDTTSLAARTRRLADRLAQELAAIRPGWRPWLSRQLARLDPAEPEPDPLAELGDFEKGRLALGLLQGRMEVRRVGVSYVIEIAYRFRNPELAAEIANATASAFVREQMETKAASARQGGAWLEDRMSEMRTKMNTATQIAQEFRSRHDYGIRPPAATVVNGEVVFEEGASAHDGPTLEELEVTAETYRKMYESFLVAYTSNLSNQSYPVADARVITPATRPLWASHPRSKLILAFGAVAGLAAGIALAIARHALDQTLRTPTQLREDLGLRCLGELPAAPRLMRDGPALIESGVGARTTRFGESLRRAKSAIRMAEPQGLVASIGIAAALPEDGKTMVASNLALLYARSGIATLLVDADAEHSVLTRWLVPQEAGAGGASIGKASGAVTVERAGASFDLLPSFAIDPRAPKLPDVTGYEIALVDLPPLTAGADRLALAGQLDGVVVVAEWGRTPVTLVRELVDALHAHGATVLGALLVEVRHPTARPYRATRGRRPR